MKCVGGAGLPLFAAYKIGGRGGFRVDVGDLVEYLPDDPQSSKDEEDEQTRHAVVEEIFCVPGEEGGERVRIVARTYISVKRICDGAFGDAIAADALAMATPIVNGDGCGEEMIETRRIESFWGSGVVRPLSIVHVRWRVSRGSICESNSPRALYH